MKTRLEIKGVKNRCPPGKMVAPHWLSFPLSCPIGLLSPAVL